MIAKRTGGVLPQYAPMDMYPNRLFGSLKGLRPGCAPRRGDLHFAEAVTFAYRTRRRPMITLASEFLRGSYVPLVTPFHNDEVDYGAFAALVAHQVEHGSHGIVVAGTTGESNALTPEERTRLLEVAVDVAKRRLAVGAPPG